MKRVLIAIVIFVSCVTLLAALLSLPGLVSLFRAFSSGDHVVLGEPRWGSEGGILLSTLVLSLLGMLSYWLSGRLIKARGRRE